MKFDLLAKLVCDAFVEGCFHLSVCLSDCLPACLQGREMMLVLKKDTLTLLDPLDHTPLHCQPIINIRVWGVGCNSGR